MKKQITNLNYKNKTNLKSLALVSSYEIKKFKLKKVGDNKRYKIINSPPHYLVYITSQERNKLRKNRGGKHKGLKSHVYARNKLGRLINVKVYKIVDGDNETTQNDKYFDKASHLLRNLERKMDTLDDVARDTQQKLESNYLDLNSDYIKNIMIQYNNDVLPLLDYQKKNASKLINLHITANNIHKNALKSFLSYFKKMPYEHRQSHLFKNDNLIILHTNKLGDLKFPDSYLVNIRDKTFKQIDKLRNTTDSMLTSIKRRISAK